MKKYICIQKCFIAGVDGRDRCTTDDVEEKCCFNNKSIWVLNKEMSLSKEYVEELSKKDSRSPVLLQNLIMVLSEGNKKSIRKVTYDYVYKNYISLMSYACKKKFIDGKELYGEKFIDLIKMVEDDIDLDILP